MTSPALGSNDWSLDQSATSIQFLLKPALHIEDFTRARVNESDFTAVLVETGAMPVPTKLQNPTACA